MPELPEAQYSAILELLRLEMTLVQMALEYHIDQLNDIWDPSVKRALQEHIETLNYVSQSGAHLAKTIRDK